MKKIKLTSFETPRAEAISDGVFAIVMTLLILEIRVPEIDWRADATQLRHKLYGLLPKFLSFFFSFANIYIFWVNHHLLFKYLKGVNRDLLFLNGLFLFFLVMIPFPTAMIGEYYDNTTAISFYGLVMFLASAAFTAMVQYAASRAHLFKDFLTPVDIRQGLLKSY